MQMSSNTFQNTVILIYSLILIPKFARWVGSHRQHYRHIFHVACAHVLSSSPFSCTFHFVLPRFASHLAFIPSIATMAQSIIRIYYTLSPRHRVAAQSRRLRILPACATLLSRLAPRLRHCRRLLCFKSF